MWYIAALKTHLTTMCEIDNDAYVHNMPQWVSGELFVGSGKKYADLKEKQVLVFLRLRGKDVFFALPAGYIVEPLKYGHHWAAKLCPDYGGVLVSGGE